MREDWGARAESAARPWYIPGTLNCLSDMTYEVLTTDKRSTLVNQMRQRCEEVV